MEEGLGLVGSSWFSWVLGNIAPPADGGIQEKATFSPG